ncbi:MAG: acyl-CoA dehydrogenase family protein, partial [Frankiaceae bacterium]
MDFTVTREQEAFFSETRAWARSVIVPGAAERDREGRWDPALWKALAAQGLAGLPIPEAYGGGGASIVECCLANEAIAECGHDAGFNLSLGAHWVIGTVPIWLHGSEELKQRWLPGLCDGALVGAWASTEPESGSDAGSIRTTAVLDGADWVLNGTKMFITNAPIADVCIVLARTDSDATAGTGISAFVVDTRTSGFSAGRELDKLGCRSSPTAEVVLQDCRVPADCMLGPQGEALWRVAFECFDWERTVMLAASVGGMAATLADAVRYAKERSQFGRRIASFQAVQHKLADMKINLETCRMAVYRAAWLKQRDLPHQTEASIAKALVGELSVRSALEAIQIHGGYGYTREYPVEQIYRDNRLNPIHEGTHGIQALDLLGR